MKSNKALALIVFWGILQLALPLATPESEENIGDQTLIGNKLLLGVPAAVEVQHPYVVSLSRLEDRHECHGALIAPSIVVTTATCESRVQGGYAVVGGNSGSTRRIVASTVHPKWRRNWRTGFNIALLRLSGPVSQQYISRITAPKAREVGETVALGFGRLASAGAYSTDDLQVAFLPIVQDWECREYLGRIHWTYFCAGGNKAATCHGDEGALLVSHGSTKSDDLLVGLASIWSDGCQDSSKPSLFVNIKMLQSWMNSSMNSL